MTIKGVVEVIGLHGALRLSWSVAISCWRSILTILQGSVQKIQGAWKKKTQPGKNWKEAKLFEKATAVFQMSS